jgi:hypothetical protein
VSQLLYRDAEVALCCFKAGSDDSLETVTHVRRKVLNCKLIFVGTKSDLLTEALASAHHALGAQQPDAFAITRTVANQGVAELFLAIAGSIGETPG